MQKAYIASLYKILQEDSNVISCLSDSGTDYDELIAREFPNQCINFGIGENNKVAACAGLASCGKIPFLYTTNAFLAYRSYEFIRDDICLQNYNVKLVGMGCGLSWSTLGPTHHTTEDISLLKVLPNLTIFSPASPKELAKCVEIAYKIKGPVYIRMGMSNETEIYDNECEFKVGKNSIIKEGSNATVFVTGSIISEVIKAREKLVLDNIYIKIINISTIKPFDDCSIIEEAKKQFNLFSVEEHNVIGGIGSSIADTIATNGIHCKLIKIGLNDCFAHGYGTYSELLQSNNIDSESIYEKIKENLS
jgi:transketolase